MVKLELETKLENLYLATGKTTPQSPAEQLYKSGFLAGLKEAIILVRGEGKHD